MSSGLFARHIYVYSDILTEEEKAWEAEQNILLKKEFESAQNANDDPGAELKHLENAFAKMEEMRKRLEVRGTYINFTVL